MMVIAVASGKGGTGKTTVATNLALALSRTQQVQYLDCDVEEPNARIFLRPSLQTREQVEIPVPRVNEERCLHCGLCAEVCPLHALAVFKDQVLLFPELCHGCGVCSFLCPEQAITEIGRAIGVVEVGVADGLEAEGAIGFAQDCLNVGEAFSPPVVRAVRKKASAPLVILEVAPGTSCPVVGAEAIEKKCRELDVTVIGRIPYDMVVLEAVRKGVPVAEYGNAPASRAIEDVWAAVVDYIRA